MSANITSDLETGIGKRDAEFFRKKFFDYEPCAETGCPKLSGPVAFTLMPWLGSSQKTPEDLDALYTCLRAIAPVRNAVETHPGFPKKTAAVR